MTARTNATTRTRTRGADSRLGKPVLARGDTLASDESGLAYRVDRFIGQGGTDKSRPCAAAAAHERFRSELCVKVSRRIDAWLREAYFGQLLDGHPRAHHHASTRSSCRSTMNDRSTAWCSSTRRTAI